MSDNREQHDASPLPADRNRDAIDPQFDGHLEQPLASMTPGERLDWLWRMRQSRRWIRAKVRRENVDDHAKR